MAGHLNGCSALFRKQVPKATYYHCASLELNLALSKTAKVPEIKCMLSTLTSLSIFFKYSPKLQWQLEESIIQFSQVLKEQGKKEIHKTKLKTMCQTRWVEKHTLMEDLNVLYPALVQCLEFIVNNNQHTRDGNAIVEANGLLSNLMSPSLIAAFQVNLRVFVYTKPLSILLQGSAMDILNTYQEIKTVQIILAELRRDAEKELNPIYAGMVTMANAAGLETMSIPRRCRRQTARNNVESSTPGEYWMRAVFVPFMNHVIKEFKD